MDFCANLARAKRRLPAPGRPPTGQLASGGVAIAERPEAKAIAEAACQQLLAGDGKFAACGGSFERGIFESPLPPTFALPSEAPAEPVRGRPKAIAAG